MAQLEFQFAWDWNRRARWLATAREYTVAAGLVLASFVVRWLLDPQLQSNIPYITFYLAIILAVRFTGTGPSLAAIFTSFALEHWFFVHPHQTFRLDSPGEWINAAFFFIISFALLSFAIANRRALDRERHATKALEKQALELAASEELNRRVLASSKDCIEVITLDGKLASMNHGGKRLLKINDLSQVLRKPWIEFWPAEARPRIADALSRAISGRSGEFESSRHNLDGDPPSTPLWWDTIITPISDQYGHPERLLAISRDITERRQAEEARRVSEERRELAMAAIGDALRDIDIAQDTMVVNENFVLNYGKPADQHWRDWWLGRIHPLDCERVGASFAEALNRNATHWSAEYRFLAADGRWGHVLDRAQIARDDSGKARRVVGVIMDLLPLLQAERRTQLLAETSNALLRSESPHQVIEQLCANVMEFLECDAFVNYLVDEASGGLKLNASGGLALAHTENLEWCKFGITICDCVAREGRTIAEEDVQRSTDVRTQVLRNHGLQAYACHPLIVGGRVIGTLSFGTRNRTRFDEDELSLMKAVADQVAIAVERQRSSVDLRRANEELEKRVVDRTRTLRETTDQLNAFCYSVAHDLRAPLRTQMGFARLLLDDYSQRLDETGQYYLRAILQAAERQSNIIHDLMAHVNVSRADLPVERVSLAEAFDQVQADLELELQQKCAVVDATALKHETVLANRSSLHLVLLNLVSNACKFVGDGVEPKVEIWAEPAADRVRLWVADNGIGIDPEDASRLFGMFQRLQKGQYPGTGMGLAIVKTAVERMGGAVGFESTPGTGSKFWVDLPAAAERSQERRPSPQQSSFQN